MHSLAIDRQQVDEQMRPGREPVYDIVQYVRVLQALIGVIVDWAIQAFGGGGTSNDHFLAAALATTRLLRLADGPDEVHRNQIGRLEIRSYQNTDPSRTGGGADPLTPEEAEAWGAGGLWPAPSAKRKG